jgi:predicted Zn-dependent peptidase
MNRNNKIAYQLSGGIEKKKDRAVYKIFGVVNTPMMADQSLKAIFSELDRLKTAFLSEDELARYKNMFKQDYLGRFSSSMEKAIFLCESYLTIRNFDDLPLELDRYLNVTKNDIVGIINRYFTADNSIILNIKTK